MRSLLTAGLASLAVAVISTHVLLAQTAMRQPDPGDAVFRRWCSTCHGDRGQGLTPEWRASWPADHQNCSAPHCHGRDHLPGAAYIHNNTVPAVIGPDTLAGFESAEELYEYLRVDMPRGWVGHLSDDDYWALTVFLLAHHGVSVSADRPSARSFLELGQPAWKWQRLEGWR